MLNKSFVLILVICATSSHFYWLRDNGQDNGSWFRVNSRRFFGNRENLSRDRERLPEVTSRAEDGDKLKKRWGYDGSADPKYVEDNLGEGKVIDDAQTVPPSDTDRNELKKGVNARNLKNEKKIKNYRKSHHFAGYDYDYQDNRNRREYY